MARKPKAGDAAYNARRRYARSAERYMKKAESAAGATAERYRQIARIDLANAMKTYDAGTTQQVSKSIRDIAGKLGVDIDSLRRKTAAAGDETSVKRAISKSYGRLEKAVSDTGERREREARMVFSSPIGQRIVAGMVDVWRDAAFADEGFDKKAMMKAVFEYLGSDSYADALEKIEKAIGSLLYAEGPANEQYATVKLAIQIKVADNTLVQ